MALSIEIINDIAGSMEAGLKCFIHKQTLEVVTIPDEESFPGMDWEDEESDWKEDIDKVLDNPEYVEIERMDSSESFKIMEDFVESLADSATKIRLATALEGYKPFGNFKHQLENAGEGREMWFIFRRQQLIEWVKKQLAGKIL